MQPIRKVSPTRVALTSYYNKTFVERSSRAVNDYGRWLTQKLTLIGLDDDDTRIDKLRLSNAFDQSFNVPRDYSMIARRMVSFSSQGIDFYFDYGKRQAHFEKPGLTLEHEKDDQVLVGNQGKTPILIDNSGSLYRDNEVIGNIASWVGFESQKAPLEVVDVSIANKSLPLGFVLAYRLGLNALIETLGCEVTRFRRGERYTLNTDEYALIFQDEVLVFTRLEQNASMVLAGLQRFHKTLKEYSVWSFDQADVYFNVLSDAGLGVRYLREIDALFPAWVDPITRQLLENMGEPTSFQGLLLRSVELLLTEWSPNEVEGAYMRYRGYERMAGMVYGELTRAAKVHQNRPGKDHAIDLNPHQVWQKIVQDPSVSIAEDANPIQTLREQEVMTYRGDGGRGGKSMVERTRVFTDSDLGVVSESTQDSGDVGVVAYLSPDPNFITMRGETRRYDKTKDGPSQLLSSSALNAPCVDHDDAKRINFVAIQQQQGIAGDGYTPTPLRTGYEQVIASRTTDMFAKMAEEDGVVTSVTKRSVVVTYKSGEKVSVALGARFGTAAGMTFPHDVVSELREGEKVKKGSILAYNRKYFTPDVFNKGQVVWKAGVMCRTAMIDDILALEDGSAISERIAKKLTTQTTEIKTVQVRFDQSVYDLVEVGDHVDLETILCTIEDPETADNPMFDQAALDTLKRLTAMTPRAKTTGTISKVECFYHGEFEDLSENLQALATKSNTERRLQAKAEGRPVYDGMVDTSFRIKNGALDPDVMAIQIYIDHDIGVGNGDKAVFANQMKTTFSRILVGENRTEDGEDLDATFGNVSVEDRMVLSAKLMGTTNTLLRVLSKHVASVYRGESDGKRASKS